MERNPRRYNFMLTQFLTLLKKKQRSPLKGKKQYFRGTPLTLGDSYTHPSFDPPYKFVTAPLGGGKKGKFISRVRKKVKRLGSYKKTPIF